ncbi:MAG: hypothetical protein ACYC2P_04595 [Paludibacteraceae bacterium]
MFQNYDAELIKQKTEIVINNGKLNRNEFYKILINNREGKCCCKISVPFSKLSKLSNLEASIQGVNGEVIRKLRNSEITERNSISGISNMTFKKHLFTNEIFMTAIVHKRS